VLAVCSLRGLHRAFPPLDPSVYSRPQLKPPCGICSFTTTTFGAHHGANQGAGRSTSRRDLHRLLEGSTLALPPSTAGLLQLPGLTSTRPGRHTRLSRIYINISGPTYSSPDRHSASSGWHIYVPADFGGPGLAYACPGRRWRSVG
jgi:hypothetical protein